MIHNDHILYVITPVFLLPYIICTSLVPSLSLLPLMYQRRRERLGTRLYYMYYLRYYYRL